MTTPVDIPRSESSSEKIPLLAVVGPTASGKSELAVRLAKIFGGEIVSADSMQIYRGMPVATAVPSAEERDGVPHHLLEFLDPSDAFSAADYVNLAHRKIAEIHARGKLPVLAGGTGLYISSVIDNIAFPAHRSDDSLRAGLREQARQEGAAAMHERLAQIDPESAARLNPGNLGRILRAIEIYELSGITMTEHLRISRQTPQIYRACIIGIRFQNRELLYERINRRVDLMLEKGLLDEARKFISANDAKTAAQAIGHKELAKYLRGECPLSEAVELLKRETRRYAKRQMTWFGKMPDVQWIERDVCPDWIGSAAELVLRHA